MAFGVITDNISTIATEYHYAKPVDTWLQGWEITGDEDQEVQAGTTAGADDLGGPILLVAGQTWTSKGGRLSSFSASDIHFSGLSGNNTIRIWLLGNT